MIKGEAPLLSDLALDFLKFDFFAVPLPLLTSNGLNYGVMVTQQILVLSFQVRVLVVQPKKPPSGRVVLFFFVDMKKGWKDFSYPFF